MSIAILATGDEIIQGDTLNTNGHFMAHALNSEGLAIGRHLACSDQEQDIIDCLQFLSQNHSIVLLIGGLGPTSDDRTRFALARFLNTPLVEFADAMAHVQERLSRANLACNTGNQQQALFPQNATLLPNHNGTAMGCCYSTNNTLFVLLPGPPKECLPMFNQYVLPVLQQTQHSDTQTLKWRLFGVAESLIADQLDSALQGIDAQTGYRIDTPYLEFKVRCVARHWDAVKQIVEPLIAPYVIATPEAKASELLCVKIKQLRQTMVVIDDATGGILQTLLQRPDTGPWLTFHEKPEHVFRFHVSGLDAYWSQLPSHGVTHVTLAYQYNGQEGREEHQIPYFSANVVHYAAEWLSFRMLHCLNQLHQFVA